MMWSEYEADRERVAAEQDAAQSGQASIALAWGALWLALVTLAIVVTLAAFGAAWITGAWLAPFGG